MLYKSFGLRKSKTKQYINTSVPHIKSSIKLDSFLNYSKISNDSLSSINNTDIKIEKMVSKPQPKNKHSSVKKSKKEKDTKNETKFDKHHFCGNDLDKTLNKSKTALSQYILLNTSTKDSFYYPNIKLLGNSRYKYTSPIMFVEDQKNNMSDINLGLVPIPMERIKMEMSEKEENEKEKLLYELQRSIVMLRRKQYNKAADKKKLRNQCIDYSSNSFKNEKEDLSEYINKMVLIQKWWNNYSKKNEMKNFLIKLENIIRYSVNKNVFDIFKQNSITIQKPMNLLCYINKIRQRCLKESIKEKLSQIPNANLLNSVELKDIENQNDNYKNINDIMNIHLYSKNKILNNSENHKSKERLNHIENSQNDLNNISETNEYNDLDINEENNNVIMKNLEINENNVGFNKTKDKNEQIAKKYNLEKIINFSKIIKKIFLPNFISKIKIDNDKQPIKIDKPKLCFLSKMRMKKTKLLTSKQEPIIQKILQIDILYDSIYKKPNPCEILWNSSYISKTRIGNKKIIRQYKDFLKENKDTNNTIKFIESKSKEEFNDMKENLLLINKDYNNKGFFISKINLKQDNKITKIQQFMKEKTKQKEKEAKTSKNMIYNPVYKSPCFIKKIRKKNYLIFIKMIQNAFKSHLNDNIKKQEKVYKKSLNNKDYYYLTKKRFVESNKNSEQHKNKLNYLILLLNIFITKNIQEYIFIKLNSNKKEYTYNYTCYFPFYLKTLKRILNYLQKHENPNKKVSLFFEEIFDYNKLNMISTLNSICFLSEEKKDKLIYSNLFTGYEENELIKFLSEFSEFDKNINNESFIIERLKKIKLNDTNIFTLVKLIDNEYNNLVKGLYCFKCYNYTNICNCYKENNIKGDKKSFSRDLYKSNERSEDNLNFDEFDFTSEDVDKKREINYFDYNKDKKDNPNNILIKTKTMNNDKNKHKLIDNIFTQNEGKDEEK